MSTRFSPRNKKGFTLIELLIVITIIGILSVALIPRISQGPAKARDVKREADLGNISTALELYYSDNGSYPLTGTAPTTSAATVTCLTNGTGTIGATMASYLQSMPTDPTSTTALGTPLSCTGTYGYYMIGDGSVSSYALVAKLETANTSGADNLYCLASLPSTSAFKTYSSATIALATSAKTAGIDCASTKSLYYVILR